MACKHVGDSEYCKQHKCCTVGLSLAMSEDIDPEIEKHCMLCYTISTKISEVEEKINGINYYNNKIKNLVRDAAFDEVDIEKLDKILDRYKDIYTQLDNILECVKDSDNYLTGYKD